MSLEQQDIERAAADLLNAEKERRQIGLLSLRHPAIGMDDAYAIQKSLIALKTETGRRRIGWKIGLTSKAMQSALGIDIPDSGVLLDDMLFSTGDEVAPGRFIQPRVEAEIAFAMRSDLQGAVSREAVIDATDYVAPALEILDTRIMRNDPKTGRPRSVFDTIADNAANAGVVLGRDRHQADAFDLRRVGAIVSRNGVVEETGLGAGVLDDPVTAILWLAERLAGYGEAIAAGDIVLSGSFIRPVEAPPRSHFTADCGDFGNVEISFG